MKREKQNKTMALEKSKLGVSLNRKTEFKVLNQMRN